MRIFKVKTINDHSEYVKARSFLHQEDFIRFRKMKKSPELGSDEKKILQAREYIHSQKWNESLKILQDLPKVSSEYLNGEIHSVKGYIYQVMAKPQETLWENERALFYYELCEDQEGLFRCHYNRAVCLESFCFYDLMAHHYEQAKLYASQDHQIVHILKAEAFNEYRLNRPEKAIEKINKAFTYKDKIEKTHLDNLKTVAAEIYVKNDDFEKASFLLKELSTSKINPEKARALCELRFLEIYQGSQKLRQVPQSVQDNLQWFLKWEIIHFLLSGETELALKRWKKLCQHYPTRYKDDFIIKDKIEEKTLFALVLHKVYRRPETYFVAPANLRKPELLVWLLNNSPTPQRKENLIEAIWKVPYEPQFNDRFYKLVQRVKKDYPITNQGGAYHISNTLYN